MATSGDFLLATSGDYSMAADMMVATHAYRERTVVAAPANTNSPP
jgi:hypothetical protein